MSDLKNVINTDENVFADAIEKLKDKKVIVDFWAPWCGPCTSLAPILEEIAKDDPENLVVLKVNVDDNQKLAMQFKVMSIPTMVFFKDAKPVATEIGVKQKRYIKDKLAAL